MLSDHTAKVIDIVDANNRSNVGNGKVSCAQKLLRHGYFDAQHVGFWRCAGVFFENVGKAADA